MTKRNIISIVFLITLIIAISSGCRKDSIITDDPSVKLSFSNDTIIFDTVFTTIGSTTQWLRVYNKENRKVNISSIRLAGGTNSNFRINIDGVSGVSASNVEIAPNDSMFIFVEVTVDPTNSNNPLIIQDSIVFTTNGNIQDVDLVAWGQDAHFIVADKYVQGLPPYKIVAKEGENITWQNDKPYVIYGYAVVDSTGQLNIWEGCRIHFHNNSGLWIYKGGSLKVSGTLNDPVTFQGDRLESYYEDVAGQWDRIWIMDGSVDNEINYAIIKNAFIGIQTETFGDSKMGNKLKLDNTQIYNMSGVGIFSRDYKIVSTNTIIANCAQYGVVLSSGGDYDFQHCTFANYWSQSVRQTPNLILNNYYENQDEQIVVADHLNAYFGNCIIYGSNDEEVELDQYAGSTQFNYTFDYCLLKTQLSTSDVSKFINIIKNSDPLFEDYQENDYHIKLGSPAINVGSTSINIPIDIAGENRDAQPDLGAYEYK
ncbi:choice-of-anchor Q domain-containing protein [Bacteroidota bacterium]